MNKLITNNYYRLLKKSILLLFLALFFCAVSAQQRILLLSDTIPLNDPDFILNAPGIGSNFGNNLWIINEEYDGHGVYPNTLNEDSVLSGLGQITGAPYSTYLHIHDAALPSGAANANWNPTGASDRFAYMGGTFCTSGLTNVIFTFFWTGEGDSTAYGTVYYRVNGGGWVPASPTKYYNQHEWKYESIQNPNFNNVPNLQFGFRWVNSGGDTTKDVSWGIDDIIAVGTYDSITNPAVLNIVSVTPDTVCQSGNVTILFSLTPPLCSGSYEAFLSDNNGNFTNATFLQPPFSFDNSSTFWQTVVDMPNNVQGSCFKLIIKRLGPPPLIRSDTSQCFVIEHCPVSIVTNSAPVMTDADTACLKSAIDVYFNSFGNFNNGNVYYAQLSDSNGSFAHPDTIGKLPSNLAYPDPTKPGSVSGLIPTSVPPGCGYYIRIVSSNPGSIGNVIGPYCLTDCDVTTNNTHDLHACINYPYATDTLTFAVTTNQWNQGASYDTCNNWTIELLDMMSFSVVNIGGLGVYHDSLSGTFTLIVGPLSQLPVAPGTYYMRIISNCSNQVWNENGTVIRITIGAPGVAPPVGILSTQGDSVYCNTGVMELYVNPYNPSSTYNWTSNFFNPITTPAVLVNIAGASVGDWVAYVQEVNNGCPGPLSAPYNFITTAVPTVRISGPDKVCLGDTAVFAATYFPATYYNWTAPPGVKIVLQSNTQVSMVFDSIGNFSIGELSINDCGSNTGSKSVKVFSLFKVDLGPGKMDCLGDSVTLTASVPPYPKTFISLDSSSTGNQGGMFNILPHNDVIIDSFAVSFRTRTPNTKTAIYSKHGTYRNFEQSASSWVQLAANTIALPGPVWTKTVIPTELNKTITAGDTVAFYITTTNTTPIVNEAYGNGVGIQQGVLFKSDGVIDFIQGCVNAYPFGAHIGPKVLDVTIYYRTKAGLKYSWNTGDTTSAISIIPTQSNLYEVKVYDTTGCRTYDTVFVQVDTLPRVYAGPDTTLCPNGGYVMPATASPTAMLNWDPATGLDQPDSLRPVFSSGQTISYILTATNPDGCKKSDSVLLNVYPLSVNAGPDTTICDAETYTMAGQASTDSIVWFPSVGLSAINILNPTFSYDQSTIYRLQVSDTNGCKLTDSVTITVVYCNTYIKVPDAFTPNNDGNNDHFTVFGQYISDYQIKIFNRWGEEVYSSTDINELNNLSKGWDGTFRGKVQDVGTFVYYINAKDMNGKNIFKKGNITLIR